MSQHDYDLANQSGAAFRADLNNLAGAIVTQNSGATAPATTFARMVWLDTTTGTIKRRNAANSDWLVESTLDETIVLSRASNTMLDVSDKGKAIVATGSFTQTFDAVATLTDGWWVAYRIPSGVTITFDPSGAEQIDGAATKTVIGPAGGLIWCNGSALFTVGLTENVSRAGDTMTGKLTTANGTGAIAVGSPGHMLEIMAASGAGNAAMVAFHRPSSFAAVLGIDTDNLWKVGGWSMGAVAYMLWHAGVASAFRAWVRHDAAATPGITGSLNVGSVTKNSTGNYTANITASVMANGNYGYHVTGRKDDVNSQGPVVIAAPTATALRYSALNGVGGAIIDLDEYSAGVTP